ncbi:MAG: OsmC family protein [Acidimicrobiales bacterium]
MAPSTPRRTTDPDLPPADPVEHRIGEALTRLEHAIERRPEFGRSTICSTTTLVDGLRCVSREGDVSIESDLGAALGGEGAGPTPSALVRAALGACLTMGYRLRAARHGVPVDSIRVEVETDTAIGGMLDPDAAFPAGFIEIRYRVEIDSPAPGGRVERLIEEADRLSPVLDAVVRPNRVTRRPGPPAGGDDR